MDGPMRKLYITFFTEEGIKFWFRRYWFVVILGSCLVLAMMAVFVYYCARFTPIDNPLKTEKTTKKGTVYYKPLVRQRRGGRGGYNVGGGAYATGGGPGPSSYT